ncbi:hypothetical protein PsYK624_091420 [Phanerochaete sordida]|uniref:Uncharacterized protein n=1 Tax=Phanerochaete sordida TaxID=48140 RepID=A0A9P3LFS2_9APHY|nr:hypothetical protein PsYK624_091420 [Phanerochaete sordida]
MVVLLHSIRIVSSHRPLPGEIVPQLYIEPEEEYKRAKCIEFSDNLKHAGTLVTHRSQLENPRLPAPFGATGATQTIAITWPGYHETALYVTGGDYELSELANAVNAELLRFRLLMQKKTCTDLSWRLLPADTLWLLELRPIAHGLWQAVLCRRRNHSEIIP